MQKIMRTITILSVVMNFQSFGQQAGPRSVVARQSGQGTPSSVLLATAPQIQLEESVNGLSGAWNVLDAALQQHLEKDAASVSELAQVRAELMQTREQNQQLIQQNQQSRQLEDENNRLKGEISTATQQINALRQKLEAATRQLQTVAPAT